MTAIIHENQPVLSIKPGKEPMLRAVILLHGRGSTAQNMIPVAKALHGPETAFYLPQARHNRWYPETAFGPREVNEPDLSSALNKISLLIEELQGQGLSLQQIYLGGFSQGACLAAEYGACNPGRYGGIFVLSGGLIGPLEENRTPSDALEGTPVFIGCSDADPWIPPDVVQKTADFFEQSGAELDLRLYPGMGHTVNEDELEAVIQLFDRPRTQ
jgi:predicted esterase